MSSDNEYFSENDEIQPETINIDNSPRESATVEQETEEQEDENVKDGKKVVKPKRIIRNPQPKFNEQTIRTAKGLPAVLNHFKDVKFKGHGFEEQDLNRLMKIYEYWCHRFFPKFTFDDSIQRLEYLGNKKSAQVYLKKVRMGIEDVFEEHISEEKIETEGFVEPFDDQFDNLLSTDNNKSEPELTEDQLERINQNRLRAEAIRKEKLLRINGETSQQSTLNTVSQNYDNEAHDLEMEANEEELGLDNILKMVNEDSDSSGCETVQNINKEQLYDKKISNAIRRNALSGSESDQSDLNNDNVTRLQKENSNENREESGDNSDHLSSSTSSNESVVLHSSQLKKKKSKSIKRINNSPSSFRKKRKISTDSDVDFNKSNLSHKSQQNKMIVESDEDNIKRPSQSHSTQKNTLIETSDSDDELPVQSNGNIYSSIKENLPNIIDDSLKQKEMNNFLDSDQESDSSEGPGKFKQKGRLIIDTDESD